MSGPEDNPRDDEQPTREEWEATMELRMIDGKFGITNGGKLVKASTGEEIPEWEPVHVMRARDRLALPLLRLYYELSIKDACNNYHLAMLDAQIARFERFAQEHPECMKQPGVTRGGVFRPVSPKAPSEETMSAADSELHKMEQECLHKDEEEHAAHCVRCSILWELRERMSSMRALRRRIK